MIEAFPTGTVQASTSYEVSPSAVVSVQTLLVARAAIEAEVRPGLHSPENSALEGRACQQFAAKVEPRIVESTLALPEVETSTEPEAEEAVAIEGMKTVVPRKVWERLLKADDEVKLGQEIQRAKRASQRLEAMDKIGMNNAVFDGQIISRTRLEEYVTTGNTAFWRFAQANKALVGWAVRGLYRTELDMLGRPITEDLLNEAITHICYDDEHGLLRAVKDFNPEMGNKFCTYAVFWIRKSLQSWIAQNMQIPISVSAYKKLRKLYKIQSQGAEDVSNSDVKGYAGLEYTSLDDTVEFKNGDTMLRHETEADPRSMLPEMEVDMRLALEAALSKLNPVQHKIIIREFGLDGADPTRTKKQLTIELGLPRSRLSSQRDAALRILKPYLADLLE